jgi:hypothetical protein
MQSKRLLISYSPPEKSIFPFSLGDDFSFVHELIGNHHAIRTENQVEK